MFKIFFNICLKYISDIFQQLKPESPTVVRWKNSLPLPSLPAQATDLGDQKVMVEIRQARKPRSYASLKLRPTYSLTYSQG